MILTAQRAAVTHGRTTAKGHVSGDGGTGGDIGGAAHARLALSVFQNASRRQNYASRALQARKYALR